MSSRLMQEDNYTVADVEGGVNSEAGRQAIKRGIYIVDGWRG